MISFVYDPVGTVIEAVQKRYPNLNAEIQFNPQIDIPGITTINERLIMIDINPSLSYEEVIEQLIHELAHAALKEEEQHSQSFKRTETTIKLDYQELVEQKIQQHSKKLRFDSR